MRAVLDTNVVVSALIWGGVPFLILEAAIEGRVDLFTSAALLGELANVVRRPHLMRRLQRVAGSVDEALDLYAAITIRVMPAVVPRVVPDDPDDDHVVAASIAANADVIVSGDRHLLAVGKYQSIRVVRPANALAIITNPAR